MIRLIAATSITTLMILSTLGNFWFTYGIWPRSWGSFIGFGFINLVLVSMMAIVRKEK